jgi:hypothetical protein
MLTDTDRTVIRMAQYIYELERAVAQMRQEGR